MKKQLKVFIIMILAFACVALTSCASPATYQAMTVTPAPGTHINKKLQGTIAIGNIAGGKKTNPLWTSEVDNASFEKALSGSLAAYGYLASSPQKAQYTLDADLQNLDQPFIGFNMTVKSTVLYTLSGHGVKKQYPVSETGKATMSDAFVGVTRLRMANEKSIHANIEAFLKQLGLF